MITLSEYFQSRRSAIDAVVFDIDGTLTTRGKPCPGACGFLHLLDQAGCPWVLLTNDTSRSHREKAALAVGNGLPVCEKNIISAGDALGWWAGENYRGELFYLCGGLGTPDYAELAGIRTTADADRIDGCAGVILGEGAYDWRIGIENVFNFFMRHPERPFIVPSPDSYWSGGDRFGIGAGGVARMICALLRDAGIEKQPVYLGKPDAPIYQCLFQFLAGEYPGRSFTPGRMLMVGDSLDSDIRGGNRNGLISCLVLTGITSHAAALAASGDRKPALIFSGI